jgi:hypothetical protein
MAIADKSNKKTKENMIIRTVIKQACSHTRMKQQISTTRMNMEIVQITNMPSNRMLGTMFQAMEVRVKIKFINCNITNIRPA